MISPSVLVPSVPALVETLVTALKKEAGFGYVSPSVTSVTFPSGSGYSLEGGLLDVVPTEGYYAYVRNQVIALLGRRPANVAETLRYVLMNPEEVRGGSRIWCLGQCEKYGPLDRLLVLYLDEDGIRCASVVGEHESLLPGDRILTLPMTPEELAARNA